MNRLRALGVVAIFVIVGVVARVVPRGRAAAPGDGAPLRVLAASSLSDTLPRVATAWTAKGNPPVSFAFDASSTLARQVEGGAPADAYLSADTEWMDHLDRKGRIDRATRADLLGNALVAIVSARSTVPVATAGELAAPQVARLALAGENVPAGRYARAALASLGVLEGARSRIVSGANVRAVLGWVASGEADAGVVYATDARVEPRVRVAFAFPATSHPPIVYPVAVVKGAARAKEAAALLAYCASPAGMAVFAEAGFTAAAPAGAP